MAPTFEPLQEMRFAVVLYGGLSLAIYMNGVVQELLHLVRATAPASPDARPNPTEALRDRRAAQSAPNGLSAAGPAPSGGMDSGWEAGPDGRPDHHPLRRRHDVGVVGRRDQRGVPGQGPGQRSRPIDQLKALWVDEGDFDELPQRLPFGDRPGLGLRKPPKSLFSGQRMYRKLLDAFDGMETGQPYG